MAKANSSKDKDKNKKIKSLKKNDKRLKSPQKRKPVPADKSLRSLKKIQQQLDDIIKQRSKEKKQIKTLKDTAKTLSQQLADTESHFPKLALNKDLKKLKNKLQGKNSQFLTITDKLSREISLFKDLTERVTRKIQTLEKASEPEHQQLQQLTQEQEGLFKKISHFEQQLTQFNSKFAQPEQTITEFAQQLEQLDQFVSQVKENSQEQDTLIKLLQADTSNIRKSLQQIQGIDNKIAGLMPKLVTAEQQNQQLIKPLEDHFKEFELRLQALQDDHETQQKTLTDDNNILSELINRANQIDEQLQQTQDQLSQHAHQIKQQLLDSKPESNSEPVHQLFSQVTHNYQEQDTQIKLLQTDTSNIRNSLQQIQGIDDKIVKLIPKLESVEQQNQHLSTRTDQLDKKLIALEQAQQLLTRPLEEHLNELELKLQALQTEYFEQQQTLPGNSEQLAVLNDRVNQFDELLHQSQDELKRHMQLLLESENNNLEQFNQISSRLDPFSQQLSDVVEQSAALKSRFAGLQEQQDNALEQLTSGQHHLAEIDKALQDNISSLTRKLAQSHNQYQKNVNKLESLQLEQQSEQEQQVVNLNRLGEQVKTRSQLFGIGLIAVLAISTLLLFNAKILQDVPDKQALIKEIKSDISNETYSKINDLTRQNSHILNKQLGQIRDSIKQVGQERGQSQQLDIQALKNNWQEKHQLLQQDISQTHTEQQTLKLSVAELSATVSTLSDEIQQRQKAVLSNNLPHSAVAEVTNINKITTPFYAIQLLGAVKKESIQRFLTSNNLFDRTLFDRTRVYETELKGQPWYIILHGHYTSFAQAREQIQHLPENLLKQSPWVRKLP